MPVTQKEIAEHLGVSRQLVSFALNGVGGVSEQTRRDILEAASRMGYRRNEMARAIGTGKSRVVGVLTHDAQFEGNTEHTSAMVAGALQGAATRGYATKLLPMPFSDSDAELEEIIQLCTAWRLDGIVAVCLRENAIRVLTKELRSSNCVVAYVETSANAKDQPNEIEVATDDYSGIYAAVEHLYKLGHRRISHLSGPMERDMTRARNAIFLRVMEKLGLEIGKDTIIESHWGNVPLIEKSVHYMLDLPERPTGVLCSGDQAGMIAMRVARRRGLSVPQDLSVIGFGNFALSAHADPPLTTIGQSFRKMGWVAMEHLLKRLEGEEMPTGEPLRELVEAQLIVRESTAPPHLT